MPKAIPAQLLNALGLPGKSTCFLIKIKSILTGIVYGFTTLDAVVRFNDGEGMMVYRPHNVLKPQNIQSTYRISEPDNTELHGWFDDSVAQAINSGLLGAAELTIYRVAYQHLEFGAEIVGFGTVGKAEFSANKQGMRKIQFRGLSEKLRFKRNPVFSITCRNEFGDERCGKPFIWHPGTITEVYDNLLAFKVTGIPQPNDYFNFGVARFMAGDNTNVLMEIEDWDADGYVKLGFVTPYAITPGPLYLRQDCDKFDVTCFTLYNNMINFNGEHMTPVQDQSLMIPGAYIKSQGAL